MPMIVGKHERTLAIDGPYIHVRFLKFVSFIFFCFLTFVRACRSCRRRTRVPRRSLIAARHHRTTSIRSFRASPASHPPLSVWLYTETAETSDTNSRRKAPKSQVGFHTPSPITSIALRLTDCTARYDRRDCTDDQRSQVCVGTHSQYHWQITAEQTDPIIRPSLFPSLACIALTLLYPLSN